MNKVASSPKSRTATSPQRPDYIIRKSAIQGKGVFAAQTLKRGQTLVEYTGERISHHEAGRRYDDAKMRRHHTFLFTVSSRTCIDGGAGGNDARFFNHSCSPNCEAYVVRGRVFIRTKRAVNQGDELTYDYNYDLDGDIGEEELRTYVCLCGSPRCRGTILGSEARARAPRSAVRSLRTEAKARAKT